jgi:hypothetical protein
VAEALVRHGHTTSTAGDLEINPAAEPRELCQALVRHQRDLITTDAELISAIYEQQIWLKRTVVLLQVEPGDVEQDDAVDRLFARYKRLSPGRLYTVSGSRVKVRQLPTSTARRSMKGE